jgi:exodeoxyribonuclease VII large subunit
VCGERAGVLQRRAARALRNTLVARRRQLEGHGKLLDTLSYQSVLQRGFALVRDSEGRTVRAAASVHPGDRLDIELHDGRIEAAAQSIRTASGTEAPPGPAAPQPGVRRPRGRSGGGQGSLF